ncbi:hypothetical protein BDD12DRAFT_472642 [Trichophaea hybrida]|nr:hypothetical protein BDD12DRAFT_472642 [Trichophaea hybrida]
MMIEAMSTIIGIPKIHNHNLMELRRCLVHHQPTLLPTPSIFSLLLPEVDEPKGYQRLTNQW